MIRKGDGSLESESSWGWIETQEVMSGKGGVSFRQLCLCLSAGLVSGRGLSRGQVQYHTLRTYSFNRPTSMPFVLPFSTRQHSTDVIHVVFLQWLQKIRTKDCESY